jgi:hypothetical protein
MRYLAGSLAAAVIIIIPAGSSILVHNAILFGRLNLLASYTWCMGLGPHRRRMLRRPDRSRGKIQVAGRYSIRLDYRYVSTPAEICTLTDIAHSVLHRLHRFADPCHTPPTCQTGQDSPTVYLESKHYSRRRFSCQTRRNACDLVGSFGCSQQLIN